MTRAIGSIGATVDGRYRVLGKIGAGGMGAVYKVEHLAMGKLAAMKVLHPSLTQDREVAQRFRREAEAVSKLSSPQHGAGVRLRRVGRLDATS